MRRSGLALFLLLVVLVLVLASPAWAAIAFVQSKNVNGIGPTCAPVFTSNITTGNAIIVAIRIGDVTNVPTIADTGLNTYVEDRRQVQTTDVHRTFIFSALNISGNLADTVTVTVTGTPSLRCAIHEYSGLATSSALDQVNSNQVDATNAPDSGNVTTTQADELLFGVVSSAQITIATAGTNYTKREAVDSKLTTEDRIVASTLTISASFSLAANDNWACLIATYKAPAAAGGSEPDEFVEDTVIPWIWWLKQ